MVPSIEVLSPGGTFTTSVWAPSEMLPKRSKLQPNQTWSAASVMSLEMPSMNSDVVFVMPLAPMVSTDPLNWESMPPSVSPRMLHAAFTSGFGCEGAGADSEMTTSAVPLEGGTPAASQLRLLVQFGL